MAAPPAPDPLHGRGLPLIRMLADHADITAPRHGTVVTMSWQLGRN
ncbi:ATP-binding protein [Amycolatopsis sp. FDAARGOS 1241]|nr:ATP-binding protein [Amycolatopsis sp. FDAARGOS 1241]